MEVFIKLPIELQRIIMDKYFEMKHDEKMKFIRQELPRKSYKINKTFTINLSLFRKNYKIFHTSDKLYEEECIQALNSLCSCKCCSRHQENRPDKDFIIYKKKLNYPFHDIDKVDLDCSCPCRHLSRWIIRGHIEQYDPILVSLRYLP